MPSPPWTLEQYGRELMDYTPPVQCPVSSSHLNRVRNSITAASWALLEIFRDLELLDAVRAEVDGCVAASSDGRISFDIGQLLRLPILQAVYAETLRLRMHFYIVRMTDRADLRVRDWIVPRRKAIVTLTTVAHMDGDLWSTGPNNEHPLDQFWVGRFLGDASRAQGQARTEGSDASPLFSIKDHEGSWIPYGGGPRQCPGRHFAKRQIFLTVALFIKIGRAHV